MTKTLIVKIITPSKVVSEGEADMVIIPGSKGEFGVLPEHVKLVSRMNVGIITLMYRDIETKYFVYGGIAQVTGEALNIITEFAVDLASENAEAVRNIITNLKNNLSKLENASVESEIMANNIEKYQSLLKFIEVK